MTSAAPSGPATAESVPFSGPLHRVLLLSPYRETAEALRRILQAFGAEVAVCEVETAFWEHLHGARWDVILHELERDTAPSAQSYARWRAVQPDAQLWLLLNSDEVPPSLADLSREKFVQVFHKPFQPDALFRALQGLPDRSVGGLPRAEAHVLVANADAAFCEDILELLTLEGHRGRTARRGREAVDEAQRRFYHVALVDTGLPDMRAWEVAARLREVNPHVMVIVLADYASLDTVLHSMRADVYDCLLKPLDTFVFRRTLQKALEKQKLGLQIQALLEGLKRANQDFMRINEVQSRFLRVVSHDLLTPLTAVKGYVQALKAGMIPAAQYPRCFATMERECEHLEHLIGDLVDFVSIEAGKLRLKKAELDPRGVFEDVTQRFQEPARQKNILYKVEGLQRAWPKVLVDPRRLDQLLTNLIGNAIKYTPSGGAVRVHFSRSETHLHVRVQDTGEGVAPEHLARVFEQFFQVNPSAPERKGLGLGLSIAREIIHRHGGEIGVESKGVGQGTAFWFTLPFLAPEQASPAPAN